MKSASELRAENARLHSEMVELNELPADKFGAEEQQKWDRLSEKFDANETRIRRLEGSVGRRQREQPDATLGGSNFSRHGSRATATREYRDAFTAYLCGGRQGMTDAEKRTLRAGFGGVEYRAQSVGTNTAGGFAVPDAQMADLERAMLAFGGLRAGPITVLQTTGGSDLPVPTNDDVSNAGSLLSENTQASDVDSTFGQVLLQAFKFTSGIIKVSNEFLQDTAIDVPSWAATTVGERIARGLAPHLIEGDGTAEPGGLDLAASFVTAANAASITRDDILDLIHAVDPSYRQSEAFRLVLGDDTLRAIKKLTVGTSDDRPLWQASIQAGAPPTIEGVEYIVDQGVAAIGAGNRSMYAGDLSKFWLREAGPVRVRRLDERYADFDQTAFVAFARYDSDIIDAGTDPIKYLRHPAS